MTEKHFLTIKKGLYLKDGSIKVDGISYLSPRNKIKVTLHSGKNRIVRRIFESLGYTVRKLERSNFAGISLRGILPGTYRPLTAQEHEKLNRIVQKNNAKPRKKVNRAPKKA